MGVEWGEGGLEGGLGGCARAVSLPPLHPAPPKNHTLLTVLRILPEVDVGVVEDVGVEARVVEGLGGEDHGHVVARVEFVQRLQEEVGVGHLVGIKHADNLVGRDGLGLRIDHLHAVVQVGGFTVHLAARALAPGHVHDAVRAPLALQAPVALLPVLAVVAQVHGDAAAEGQVGGRSSGAVFGDNLQRFRVAGHEDAHVVRHAHFDHALHV